MSRGSRPICGMWMPETAKGFTAGWAERHRRAASNDYWYSMNTETTL